MLVTVDVEQLVVAAEIFIIVLLLVQEDIALDEQLFLLRVAQSIHSFQELQT